jgi:hypothetical protein
VGWSAPRSPAWPLRQEGSRRRQAQQQQAGSAVQVGAAAADQTEDLRSTATAAAAIAVPAGGSKARRSMAEAFSEPEWAQGRGSNSSQGLSRSWSDAEASQLMAGGSRDSSGGPGAAGAREDGGGGLKSMGSGDHLRWGATS